MTLNEDLSFMGGLLAKMRVELFHTQHIHVDLDTVKKSTELKNRIFQLSSLVHQFCEEINDQRIVVESTIKPMETQLPLRTSSEALTRLRKFNGSESEEDKIDFFEHD